MPSTWTFGMALMPSDALTLMMDVQQIYSQRRRLGRQPDSEPVQLPDLQPGQRRPEVLPRRQQGPGLRLGRHDRLQVRRLIRLLDSLTWRAGFSFTNQPIPTDQMTFNILAPA